MSASKLIPQPAPCRSNITLTFSLEKALPTTAAPTELSFLRIPPSTWDCQVQETQNCRHFSTLSDCSSQFVLFLFSWVTAVERPARQPRKNANGAPPASIKSRLCKSRGRKWTSQSTLIFTGGFDSMRVGSVICSPSPVHTWCGRAAYPCKWSHSVEHRAHLGIMVSCGLWLREDRAQIGRCLEDESYIVERFQ